MASAAIMKQMKDFVSIVDQAMKTNSVAQWSFNHGMYVTGTNSPRAFVAAMQSFTLSNGVAEQIQCPTLVCDAGKDLFLQDQAQQLFDHLTCPKTMLTFTDEEGAGAHCEMGASRLAYARIYDWLDDTLKNI